MCGDATSRDDVMRLVDGETVDLVLTDPPYGIRSVNPKTGQIGRNSKIYPVVIGDTDTKMFREAWRILRTISPYSIIWGGQNYADVLPPSCGWLFWDKEKNTEKLSFGDGELAYCNFGTKVKKYTQRWNGYIRDGEKSLNEKIHPNQKPVELHARILEDFSQPEDIILDCFGGSGTTLVACEITGRRCLMMELSPDYCDIIINRYNTLTEGQIFS